MDDTLTLVLAETLARNPGMAVDLMHRHIDDGTGHCAGCWSLAHQPTWPCTILWHVTRAYERQPTVRPVPGFGRITSGSC